MASSTQHLGAQIRPFLLDVSRNLDVADGVLGVAFMPEGTDHVYFAEFVGPAMHELVVGTELAEHQCYELDCMNYLSIKFKEVEDKRISLTRATILSADMEPLIRDPLIILFGGRESVPPTIRVFVEPLKERYSYLYYIPRNEQSNEAWDTLCHASFLVAQLLWSTLATAMAAGAVSRKVTRPILMCLPRYFPEYEDKIHQMLEDIDRVRSVSATVSAYVDIESRTIPTQFSTGVAQPRPYALTIRVAKEGSIPIEVLRLELQWDDAKSPLDRSLFGKPSNKQQRKQVIAFLLLRKAMLHGDDVGHTHWREIFPVIDAQRAVEYANQLDNMDGKAGTTAHVADVSDRILPREAAEKRVSSEQLTKDAQGFVRKRVSDADKWLRKQLGLPTKEPFWFVGSRDGSYRFLISTTISPELKRAIKSHNPTSQGDAWLLSMIKTLHGGIDDDDNMSNGE